MYVYVCVYIYIYACVYVCICIHVCVCVRVYGCVREKEREAKSQPNSQVKSIYLCFIF